VPEADPLVGTGIIAQMAEVNAKTVTRWIDRGWLALAMRTEGGHRRCRLSVVQAYLKTLRAPAATA
jgi:DNA-binding transcriptional MerR regulator